MRLSLFQPLAALSLALFAAACGQDQSLHDLPPTGDGPDEFAVLPSLPLVMPDSNALPQPTPGGSNRADRNPVGEGITALGGNPGAEFAGGIPARDAALVAYAGREGTDPAIRQTLATEDAAIRSGTMAGSFDWFSRQDPYYKAYAFMALDAYAEMDRLNAAGGIDTPTAPPL